MPHALHVQSGRVVGSDASRAERADGSAGEGWVFVAPEVYGMAVVLTDARWDAVTKTVRTPTAEELAAEKAAAEAAAIAAKPQALKDAEAALVAANKLAPKPDDVLALLQKRVAVLEAKEAIRAAKEF